MKFNLKWSFNNSKLKKTNTVSFNLPAFRSADGFAVCPKAGGCATLCYARQGYYVMPTVAATREFNLSKIRASFSGFIKEATEDLDKIKQTSIRLHDSGDFFNQTYLDCWIQIAWAFPKKKFYAYTKSLHLDFSAAPKNLTIIQSAGGVLDKAIDVTKSHSRIFATHADRKAAGYIDGNVNDKPAIKGKLKIGLVYHGSKNLKAGQIAWLKAV